MPRRTLRRLRQSFVNTAGAVQGHLHEARHACRAPCEAGCAPELGSLGTSSSLLGCSMTSRNAVAASPKYTVTSLPCPSKASPSCPFRSCSCEWVTKQHYALCHELRSEAVCKGLTWRDQCLEKGKVLLASFRPHDSIA